MGAGLSRLSGPTYHRGCKPLFSGKDSNLFLHLISASEGESNPTTLVAHDGQIAP